MMDNRNTINPFIEQFQNYSTEHLLERRALGHDGLVPLAHEAIEYLLTKRGVQVPPIPTKSILVDQTDSQPARSKTAQSTVLIIAALITTAVAQQFAMTWVGLVFTACVAGYVLLEWSRRQTLTTEERSNEEREQQSTKDGLTELMTSAAAGNIQRVTELIEYGANVNAQSKIGSTALMYAVKNGHSAVVELLLSRGANPRIETNKGSTAINLAEKTGNQTILELIQRTKGSDA